ncbi:EamA domain-containing membrane protein RarD [Reichenbachiella faecimaris]|uniref:EamA domain-containing membrane protein RarD n=1 Tax=Reichenbachiella faecimaris TaxID=692418 RepID=A0A1W2GHD0_REIFA|nr:DMT family transporter [Reichenbachiella faecimaris]SMD35892.1 EamA domain-containing membrane protein RarD [Reichenbachiella faecimaris]
MNFSKGVQFMIISTFTFALMKVCVKMISHIPAIEIIFFRSIISIVLCAFFFIKDKINPWGSNKKILILRGVVGSIALASYFYILQQIPLAAAASMQYMAPIFTAILGVFIVKEHVSGKQYFYFLISFLGIIVIQGFDARISMIHLIIGIGGAIFTGLAYNCIRILKNSEHPLVIIFYFPLVSLPLAGAISFFNWINPVGWDWMYLLLVGIFTQIAQYFMTRSYQAEELSKVSIINYMGIIYSLAFGFIIFGETYEWLSYIGMALVIIGIILNLRYKKA